MAKEGTCVCEKVLNDKLTNYGFLWIFCIRLWILFEKDYLGHLLLALHKVLRTPKLLTKIFAKFLKKNHANFLGQFVKMAHTFNDVIDFGKCC